MNLKLRFMGIILVCALIACCMIACGQGGNKFKVDMGGKWKIHDKDRVLP